MYGKATARAKRTARAVYRGQEILELLNTPELKRAIFAAAEAGYPPVAAVSQSLIDAIGLTTLQTSAAKMFIGICISSILEDTFRVSTSRVRMSKDPLFSTGAVYSKIVADNTAEQADLLERLLENLSEEEARRALRLLKSRLARS